jgi:hypothetical protein
MLLRTSLSDSVGLKTHVWNVHAVLPTKTSLWCNQLGGSPPSVSSACSQVLTTRLVNTSFLMTLVAFILSMVSLSFIARSHLVLISSLVRIFPWITLSHLSTQVRYADSESSICRRRDGPCIGFFLAGGSSLPSLVSACRLMHPQPSMIPVATHYL